MASSGQFIKSNGDILADNGVNHLMNMSNFKQSDSFPYIPFVMSSIWRIALSIKSSSL